MIYSFEKFLESVGVFGRKLRNPDYMMDIYEVLKFLPLDMPKELIDFILSWKTIKKSPYGQTWYSARKDWSSYIDGEYRVADHWNFFAKGGYHCRTIQEPNLVNDSNYWYVGQYDELLGKYNIIKSYPKSYGGDYLKKLRSEIQPPSKISEEEIQKRKQFKVKIDSGLVKAELDNGEIVTVLKLKEPALRGKRTQTIYYEKDGVILHTPKFKFID